MIGSATTRRSRPSGRRSSRASSTIEAIARRHPSAIRRATVLSGATLVGCATFAGCAVPAVRQPPLAPPRGAAGPRFAGAPPKRLVLDARPLGVSPDGLLRFLVRARFADARGRPTALLAGGDVAFVVTDGDATAQWQTRLRFGGPAAIVSFASADAAVVTVRAAVGVPLAAARVRLDPREWHGPRIVARALGPYAVQIGWFAPLARGLVRIARGAGPGTPLARVDAGSSYRDDSVVPDRTYRYAVALAGAPTASLLVATPPVSRFKPHVPHGKAMWLSFSATRDDAHAFTHLDARAIARRAGRSGVRAIELRVAYGAFSEITNDDRPYVDALLDAAAARDVAVIAWTVPRSTAFEDVALAASLAGYRTPRGTRFAALAVDLERGDDYLGSGPIGYAALATYLGRLRAALGPHYPLVATVEDPYLERLDERAYPYRAIAASASVLQPMAYWRMLSPRATSPADARAALRGSYATTLRDAHRTVAIDVGGQTTGSPTRGAPAPAEIAAAIDESRRLGAIGITFFDWDGTSDAAWSAVAATPWREGVTPEMGQRPQHRDVKGR